MGQIPPERFRRALRGLDGDAFAALVADLWARTGWDAERDGQLVLATKHGETRRLLVLPPRRGGSLRRAPSVDGPVDAVVSPRAVSSAAELPRGTPDVEVFDADDVRERALYALDREERSAFFEHHLGVSPAGPQWDSPSVRAVLRSGVSELDASTAFSVLLVAALVVGVVATGGPAGVLDSAALGTEGGNDGAAAGAGGTGDASAAASEDESDGDDSVSDPDEDDRPDVEGTAVYDVRPTCERGPGEVARVVSDALTGPEPTYGLRIYWDFANPSFKSHTDYGAFVVVHRSALDQVLGGERIVLEEPEPIFSADERASENATVTENGSYGGVVRVNATVVDGQGSSSEWVYELERYQEPPREGCWVVNHLVERELPTW